jgi:hypothetical protein
MKKRKPNIEIGPIVGAVIGVFGLILSCWQWFVIGRVRRQLNRLC